MPDTTHLVIALVAVVATLIALKAMSGGKKSYKTEIEGLVSSALIHKQQGNSADAKVNLERAIKLLEYPDSRDDAKLASCYIHLAEIYDGEANHAGAKDVREKLIKLWTKQLQTGDPTALLDIDFAMTHNSFGPGTPQVLEFYDKVVLLKEKQFGTKSPQVADAYLITARLLRVLGEKESAELAEQKAAEIRPTP